MSYKTPASTAQKWALLVGINRYKYADSYGFHNLDGCLNDVADIKSLLTGKFGFPSTHVSVLKDNEATRSGILRGIQNLLVEKAGPNDIVVLYYSGHGSEAFDPERINEYDQTLVPHDGRDPKGEIADITGNDLLQNLKNLRTSYAIFIFDSCHSGTMLARREGKPRSIPKDTRSLRTQARRIEPLQPSGLRPPSANYALLAACAPNELSVEVRMEGRDRGLLTYFLSRELRRASHPLTYRDLMDYLSGMILTQQPDQHPQLEGTAADSWVFGDTTAAAPPYVLASPQNQDLVTFDAGRELGMTIGSTYLIYPPEAKQLDLPEASVATAEIIQVYDFESDGRIILGGPVLANSRAVEHFHKYKEVALQICLDATDLSETMQTIEKRIAEVGYVRMVQANASYDLRLWEDASGVHVEPKSGLPITPVPYGAATVDAVLQKIARLARWNVLLALDNPSSQLDVEFVISPIPAQRKDYFDDGMVECTVINRSAKDLYISILDFSADSSIHTIFPVEEPSLLYAGRTLHKCFGLKALDSEKDNGWDTLKLIASTVQRGFHILETEDAQNGDINLHLLPQPLFSVGKGVTETVQLVASEDWTTREQSFMYSSAKLIPR